MTVHKLQTVTETSLSPSRQALVNADAEVKRLQTEIAGRERRVQDARQADTDVATAEAALKEAAFEALLSPAGELAKPERTRLVASVTDARSRQAGVAKEEADLLALSPQHARAQAARRKAMLDVVAEEANRLAAFHRAHAMAALQAKAGAEALARWVMLAMDEPILGNAIAAALSAHPPSTPADPGALSRSIASLEASLESYSAEWVALPARLERGDFGATVEEPTVG